MVHVKPQDKDVFVAALSQRSLDERASFLDKACGADVDLRRRVEALLAAHDAPDDRLDHPQGLIGMLGIANPPADDYQPGQVIASRYKLLKSIGEGGMGRVWEADQIEPVKRRVAIKLIKLGMDTRQVLARFEAERQALALMDHPNIAKVFDGGQTDKGRPYFVMELVHGASITEYCDQSRLTCRQRLDLFLSVCHAVQHAHQKGVIHRDIKPSNVLVTVPEGRPIAKVIDFGVAKAVDEPLTERSVCTRIEQLVVGTPRYMSPEQAEIGGVDIDTRTDIYSLGVLLYELLTGTTPFDEDRLRKTAFDEIRRIIREEDPPKPSSRLSQSGDSLASVAANRQTEPAKLSKAIRGDLDWIVMKALEKNRTRRYETANSLARDVQRYLADEPVEASPPSAVYRTRKFVHRNKAKLGVLVLSLLLGGGLGGTAWFQWNQRTIAESNAELESRSKQRLQLQRQLGEARDRLRVPTQGRRQQVLDRVQAIAKVRDIFPAGPDADRFAIDLRSLVAAAFCEPDIGKVEAAQLPGTPFNIWHVAVHPDGDRLAIGTHVGPIIWRSGTPLSLPPGLDEAKPRPRLNFSRDGKWLATATLDGGIQLCDGESMRVVGDWKPPAPSSVLAISFAPSSDIVKICRSDGTVQTLKCADLAVQPSQFSSKPADEVSAAAFSDDTSLLAVGQRDGTIQIYKADETAPFRTLKAAKNTVEALAFSPDTHTLAVGTKGGILLLWDVADAIPLHRFVVDATGIGTVLFSPDGNWILAGNRMSGMKMWEAATGKQVLTGPEPPVGFSRDGRHLAGGGSYGVVLCEFFRPEIVRRLFSHRAPIDQIVWSRDCRHFATFDTNFQVCVWDVANDNALDVFHVPPGAFYASNAAAALGHSARWLAFANGGDSIVLIRDVANHRAHAQWELPRGWERLAALADDRFVLVREEEVTPQSEKWQSAVWELQVASPPKRIRIIRPFKDGERGFITSGVTPDGRYYWWVGPRAPYSARRVEIRETATGALVKQVDHPSKDEWYAKVTPDGMGLLVSVMPRYWLEDLSASRSPVEWPFWPRSLSSDCQWFVAAEQNETGTPSALTVHDGQTKQPWVRFENADFSPPSNDSPSVSPDGHYAAFGGHDGTITLVNLQDLRRQFQRRDIPPPIP